MSKNYGSNLWIDLTKTFVFFLVRRRIIQKALNYKTSQSKSNRSRQQQAHQPTNFAFYMKETVCSFDVLCSGWWCPASNSNSNFYIQKKKLSCPRRRKCHTARHAMLVSYVWILRKNKSGIHFLTGITVTKSESRDDRGKLYQEAIHIIKWSITKVELDE